MNIYTNTHSLFDYIGGNQQSHDQLSKLANNNGKDITSAFKSLDQGMVQGKFDETLKLMESGQINLSIDKIKNYLGFNQEQLGRELRQLAQRFDLPNDIKLSLDGDKVKVVGDSQKHTELQHYLDKDGRLNKLIRQTGKLSQFVEWGNAKNEAATFKQQGMEEDKLVSFLKDARQVLHNSQQLSFSSNQVKLSSSGHTQGLVEKITGKEKESTTAP